jgi:hypothetical protein
MATRKATQAKDREHSKHSLRPKNDDPQYPFNAQTPLGEFAGVESPFDIDDGFLHDGMRNTAEAEKPFWDRTAITALSLAALTGAIIGVPIGRYLHRLFF